MTDYIERCALMRRIEQQANEWGDDYDAQQVLGDVEDFPAADVRPVVHGRWVLIASTYDRVPIEKRYECSECHHETITHNAEPWERYCPCCGALNKEGEGLVMAEYICGYCGGKYPFEEISEDPGSDTGWVCTDCIYTIHPEYLEWGEY